MLTLSTRARRLLARQSRLVSAAILFATFTCVALTYVFHRQPHLLPRPWTYDEISSWEWGRFGEGWAVSGRPDDGSALAAFHENDKPETPHQWDMTCHEGVERDLRVALYDMTPFHEEVIGSILSTLNDTGVHADVYRRFFRYGFRDILETFFPTDEGEAFHWHDQLLSKLEAGEYDALIMTSCDERWVQPQLLELLPTLTSIPIICLHHEMWSFELHRPRLLNSAKAGKLTFVTLGEHVRTLVREENIEPWTQDGNDGDFAWKDVPTEVFVPIFPLPESISLPSRLAKKLIPNDVAILGDVSDNGRRNYPKFWADLITAIRENPSAWGYTISPDNGHFVPSAFSGNVQPFKVHLFGGREEGVQIPTELEEHVIIFHRGLDYVDYYRELSKLDLVLPILGSEEYTRNRATAAFPAGIISRVPSLVTPRLLKSYNYLEPPAIILHPDGTDEVEILAAMRRGEDPWTAVESAEDQPPIARNRYSRSRLIDRYLPDRPFSQRRKWDWDRYVGDVRAYNAKLLCKALLR